MKLRYDDEKHAYWLDGKRCKGVSTLAKTLESTYALEQWQMRMVAIGMAKNPALVEAVAVNFDDKDKMRDLVDKAKAAAGSFVAQDRGTTLHQVTERHDLGLALIDTDTNTRIRDAWQAALDRAGLEVVTDWVERIVVYPSLKIAGRFDRYLRRKSDGRLVVADTKSGARAVDYPHPIAIQLAFYANAPLIACSINGTGETEQFEPNPGVDTTIGYTIHMPTDDYAEIVEFDIAAGWEAVQTILLPTLKWRDRKNLVHITTPPLADLLEASCVDVANKKPSPGPDTPPPNLLTATPSTPTGGTSTGSGTTPPTSIVTTGTFQADAPTTTLNSGATTTTAGNASGVNPTQDIPTEAGLKARLRQILVDQPDLAKAIGRRWPDGVPAIKGPWTTDHCELVGALLDELDIEGPLVDQAEFQKAAYKLEHLTEAQRARVLQWVQEAASDPNRYRPLALGAGNHTTRRINLAETCLLIAGHDIDDSTFYQLMVEVMTNSTHRNDEITGLGQALGLMNWRQAQHLLTLTRMHLNLHTTIESDPT